MADVSSPGGGSGLSPGGLSNIFSAVQNIAKAIGQLNQTIGTLILTTANTWTALQTFSAGIAMTTATASTSVSAPLYTSSTGNMVLGAGTGTTKFAGSGTFSANSSTATTLGSLGPAGAHTTVQTWLTIIDSTGTTRYLPCW
jgi:hypothetical protein